MQKTDALTVWKYPASKASWAARAKQFARPPVSMGTVVCWAGTSQAKDKKLELDTAAERVTHTKNTPRRSIHKATWNHE